MLEATWRDIGLAFHFSRLSTVSDRGQWRTWLEGAAHGHLWGWSAATQPTRGASAQLSRRGHSVTWWDLRACPCLLPPSQQASALGPSCTLMRISASLGACFLTALRNNKLLRAGTQVGPGDELLTQRRCSAGREPRKLLACPSRPLGAAVTAARRSCRRLSGFSRQDDLAAFPPHPQLVSLS